MSKIFKDKIVVVLVVFATLILAGVTIFTALRIYQVGKEPIAPTAPRKSYAFECTNYDLTINTDGTVRITNNTNSPQPTQTIDLLVDGVSIGSFTVPALDPQTNTALGYINLPAGDFNWSIQGLTGCTQDGTNEPDLQSCNEVNLVLAAEVSQTPTPTAIITSSPTPTTSLQETSTPTPTTTTSIVSSPTPTLQLPPIPDSGISLPTIVLLIAGVLVILASLSLTL